MPPPYKRVAVIGTGPSGLAAVRALSQEKKFDTIRVFERRDRVGGTWLYDPTPDIFNVSDRKNATERHAPPSFPDFTSPFPQDPTSRTGIYDTLDSNVGAKVMAFTHTPLPEINTAASVERFGRNNPTRPWEVVAWYLEDLFKDYLHFVSLNTTVEKVEKIGSEWVLTLRRSGQLHHGQPQDFWYQERFDAVVAASGHYTVAQIPSIPGLAEAFKAFPDKFEHSKAYRSPNNYVGKRIIVVGGNISAGDTVADLHTIVEAPLYLSQRGSNEALVSAWNLPNIKIKPTIKQISTENGGIVEFADGSKVENFDKIIFATGYLLSYPFLQPNPVTPANRLAGFYQHIFKIGDPSLAVIGQVKAAISFRVNEYQAVAVARYFAGRAKLPDVEEQREWEKKRLEYKGGTNTFHEIKPDFAEYFNFLRDLAGPPTPGTDATELPLFKPEWAELGFQVLVLKDRYWKSLGESSGQKLKAKL